MKVSKEELLHIAKLADLKIEDDKIDNYLKNLDEILNFANTVNNAQTQGVKETVAVQEKSNVFRKDEVNEFENKDLLLQNAPDKENGMFRIPKVL